MAAFACRASSCLTTRIFSVRSLPPTFHAGNREGLIAHREDVRDGFKKVPESFMALFTGTNDGTLLARIADSSQNPI